MPALAALAALAALRPRAIATDWCLTNLTLAGALRSRLRSDLRRLLQDERVDVQRVHCTNTCGGECPAWVTGLDDRHEITWEY